MKKLILMAVGCIALNLCFADPVWELGQSDKATDTDAQIQNDNYQSDYKRELQTEDDGYQWYKIRSLRRSGRYGSPYGAEDRHGRTIIPCRYDFICYHTTDKYFHVKSSNGGSGIYLPNGTCVISPDRGYTKAYYYKKDGYSYCSVYRGEYEGICDGNGKEIISPDRGYTGTSTFYKKVDGYNYYSVYRGEYEGICDGNGKEIISPDRGYTTINI